jgi:hypothetical protein
MFHNSKTKSACVQHQLQNVEVVALLSIPARIFSALYDFVI